MFGICPYCKLPLKACYLLSIDDRCPEFRSDGVLDYETLPASTDVDAHLVDFPLPDIEVPDSIGDYGVFHYDGDMTYRQPATPCSTTTINIDGKLTEVPNSWL